MAFWLIALIVLAATVALQLLMPKPKFDARKPATLGDFQFPTVDETRVISLIRGTVLQEGYNTLDAGDFKTEPIKKSVPNPVTFGITKKKITTGYRYHVGLMLGLADAGWPVTLKEIFVDKHSVWTGSVTNGTITVDKPMLHGGDEKGGGYAAILDFYGDTWAHTANTYWESVVMADQVSPTYNGQVLLVQRGPSAGKIGQQVGGGGIIPVVTPTSSSGYFSTGTTVPPMGFVLQCCPTPFGDPAKAVVNDGDYNVANFLWEILTNTDWGMSEPATRIDLASFTAAQATFFTEGMGVSVAVESARRIRDFVADLERLADCALYVEPTTGLWTLKLIRADYDPAQLLVLNESNVLEYVSLDIPAPLETANQVLVKYVDKATWKERTADAKDLAGRYNLGYGVTTESAQWGCANATLAARLALNVQIQIALNLPRAVVVANRQAHKLRVGDAFKLSRVSRGTPERIFRAIRIKDGALGNDSIEIESVLDVFAFTSANFSLPGGAPGGLIGGAAAATNNVVEEQPYFLSGANVKIQGYAAQPNGSQENYDFYLSEDGGTNYSERDSLVDFCPAATVVAEYPRNTPAVDAAGLVVTNLSSLTDVAPYTTTELRQGFNLFRWATGEICACESVGDLGNGTFRLNNVWRGLLDTVPARHAAGEKLYFFPYGYAVPEQNFTAAQALKAKLLTRTFDAVLPLASATAIDLTTNRRYERPLPPANVTVNGSATSTAVPAAGSNITIGWNHRDRLQQVTVLKQDEASVGPESGTTYTVVVYDANGSALATYAGLSGTSWVHTTTLQTADGTANLTGFIYQVFAVRGGLNSWTAQLRPVARPGGTVPTAEPGAGGTSGGYGTAYGSIYGG